MYEEWFQSMADDEDMPTPNEINVIKDYINNNIPANEAAVRCTSRIALEHNPDPTLLWSLFESMAVELPDTQDKVVELLAAIKRLPDPSRNGQEHRINGQKIFSELAYFGAGFSDYWAGKHLILSKSFTIHINLTQACEILCGAPQMTLWDRRSGLRSMPFLHD